MSDISINAGIIKDYGNSGIKILAPREHPGFYHLVYTDQKPLEREKNVIYSKLLRSKRYNLVGKPDYIYRHSITKSWLPVEIKSGIIGDAMPHKGDLMQMTAYF
ncbi:MAG: hypothetical protein FWD01_02925, partial [Defluviitaleaceae bacterium]|nr:hypothetical protein [Defluviitaleaceae bacterium]